jgi:hypothetical protein
MTASPRSRKRQLQHRIAAFLAVVLSVFAVPAVPSLQAATTERVVTDVHTGLALYGVDPVAYFTDGKPTVGKGDFEYRFAGAIWRFANEGNRAAFMADPEVYMPRYGGYDPIGVARGLSTAGFAEFWVIYNQRLFLFYTAEARQAFLEKPETVIAAASARWSSVKQDLAD